MKHATKRMFAAAIAAALMTAFPLSAVVPSCLQTNRVCAADAVPLVTENGLSYTVQDGMITITRYDDSAAVLEIPSEIGGLPVTTIQEQAFLFCDTLQEVYIPDSVTRIAQNAFDSCTSLVSVRLSNCITEIAPHTFETCVKLKEITIPEGVTTIGARAFYHCSALETIHFPESLTTIADETYTESAFGLTPWLMQKPAGMIYAGRVAYRYQGNAASGTEVTLLDGTVSISYGAFLSCSGITSVVIPASVKYIDAYAFQKCRDLKSITIPDGVERIGTYAFSYCVALQQVTIGDSVTEIGQAAFFSCPNLTAVTLPKKLQTLQASTFQSCAALKTISLPAGMKTIEKRALAFCSALTSLQIPASVTEIGIEAFANTLSLSEFTVAEANTCYAAVDGVLFSKDLTTLVAYPTNRDAACYVVPAGVVSIAPCAFFACDNLTEVVFPESLEQIGKESFTSCAHLKTAALPYRLTTVGDFAFEDCTALTAVTIPPSVVSIGTCAFGYRYDATQNADVAVENYTIYGTAHSAAETYAAAHKFTFVTAKTVLGDLNGDQNVTMADVVLLQRVLVRDETVHGNLAAADMDQNGAINGFDLSLLKRKLLTHTSAAK